VSAPGCSGSWKPHTMQTADGIDSLGTHKGNQGTILYVTVAKLGYGTDYLVYVRTDSVRLLLTKLHKPVGKKVENPHRTPDA
jgi:hypothetical protein